MRDARFDAAAHANHDAFWQDPAGDFPLTLLSDPAGNLSRAVGAQRDLHWSGPMVHPTTFVVDRDGIICWAFQSKMAQRRPSPVRLAGIAGAVATGETVPQYIEE